MISKDQFIKRVAQKQASGNDPKWIASVDENWEMAIEAASILESRMPSIGFLSERKRLLCFLAVCSQIDRLMELNEITLEGAMLAQHILLLTNKNFSKAHAMFMHRAPNMSWQEVISFPRMALEWFKTVHG